MIIPSQFSNQNTLNPSNNLVPTVLEDTPQGQRAFDLYSKLLSTDRIIMVWGDVHEHMAKLIVSQLLFLDSTSKTAPIKMYIQSNGGCVHSGLSIIDTMDLISAPVHTFGMGICASMGSAILTSGEKGNRYLLPSASIMFHQVSSGTRGHVADQQISLEHSIHLNNLLYKRIAVEIGNITVSGNSSL